MRTKRSLSGVFAVLLITYGIATLVTAPSAKLHGLGTCGLGILLGYYAAFGNRRLSDVVMKAFSRPEQRP